MGFGATLFAAMDALSDADKKDRQKAIEKLGDTIELEISPAGTIIAFGGTSAPIGYLVCDGAAVSRTGESVLFAAIGTVHGVGDGSTTFNKPDYRGAGLRGTGSHGSETMANGNPFAGPAVGSFEDDQFQGHKHALRLPTTGPSGGNDKLSPSTNTGGYFNEDNIYMGGIEPMSPVADDTSGTPRAGDETRPFAAGVLYCIKT